MAVLRASVNVVIILHRVVPEVRIGQSLLVKHFACYGDGRDKEILDRRTAVKAEPQSAVRLELKRDVLLLRGPGEVVCGQEVAGNLRARAFPKNIQSSHVQSNKPHAKKRKILQQWKKGLSSVNLTYFQL